jgi:hypothetical protein
VEKQVGFALAESQIAAIRLDLMAKVLVMTGGPGVGKTTIVKAILCQIRSTRLVASLRALCLLLIRATALRYPSVSRCFESA